MAGLPFKRLASFVGLQGLSAVVPLLVLPAINAIVGADGWVALSIGYGIGAAAVVVGAYSWPVLGPHRVAAVDASAAAVVYWESLITRLWAWAASSVVGGIVAAFLVDPQHRALAVSMAVAIASWAMTPSWYFVGRGKASAVARYETVPRLVSSALAIPLVSLSDEPLVYPALVLATSVATLVVATKRIMANHPVRWNQHIAWRERFVDHASLTLAALIGTGYTSLVLPIARTAHPGTAELSNLAAATRIRNMAQMGTAAVTSGLQGWASEGTDEQIRHNHRRKALVATSATGVLSAVGLTLVMPIVGNWLFGDVSHVSWSLSVATATACIPYAIASSLSFHVLAPLGRPRAISASRIAATVIGVPAILLGTVTAGAVGALLGTTLAECVVVVWQLLAARDYLFGWPAASHGDTSNAGGGTPTT